MRIIQGPDLKQMSTLKMGGRALAAYFPGDYRDLEALGKIWLELGPDVLILGKGSNILFQDGNRDFSMVVWGKNELPVVIKEAEDRVVVLADTGTGLPGFLSWCARHGLTGLENLVGIPGKLGGAIAMNAGSYGVEAVDLLKSVTVWTPETGIMEIRGDDFETGYRKFKLNNISGLFIILKAVFTFKKDDPHAVRTRMKKYYSMKKSAQPILRDTAGCVFKNPVDFEPAGMLLEKAGFRGRTRGGVCFSEMHSNFLVNVDKGSSQAAMELISQARDEVCRIFGTSLELEIRIV